MISHKWHQQGSVVYDSKFTNEISDPVCRLCPQRSVHSVPRAQTQWWGQTVTGTAASNVQIMTMEMMMKTTTSVAWWRQQQLLTVGGTMPPAAPLAPCSLQNFAHYLCTNFMPFTGWLIQLLCKSYSGMLHTFRFSGSDANANV